MKRSVYWIVVALMLATASIPAFADQRLIVGFGPGGTSSIAARYVAQAMEDILGSTVIVENKPGASGWRAAKWVSEQSGSSTLFFMSATSEITVSPKFGLVPIGILATYPYVFVAKKGAPTTLNAYLDASIVDKNLRIVASPGAGSVPHLLAAKLFRDRGVVMVHVPFDGARNAVTNVMGGHVALAVVPRTDFPPNSDLQVLSDPDGLITTQGWIGIYAPPDITHEDVERLQRLLQLAVERASKSLKEAGFDPGWRNGEELSRIHTRDYELLKPVADQLGIVVP